MIYCPECGGIIEKEAVFCGHCGNALPEDAKQASGEQIVSEEDSSQKQTEILMERNETNFKPNPPAEKIENALSAVETAASVKPENQILQPDAQTAVPRAEPLTETDDASEVKEENNQSAKVEPSKAETENNSGAQAAPLKPEKTETSAEEVFPAKDAQTFAPQASEADETTHEAIKIPQNPIGSSMYDSIEPTFVSVQIFEPSAPPIQGDEKLEAENKKTPEDAGGSPTKNETKAAEPAKPSSPTSPNISISDTGGRAKAKLKPLDEGTVLNNRYEIIRRIGGGGMGAVYLASDRNLGGVLRAVKEMVQSYIEDAQQEKAVNDFRRESLLLTSLEHPSIPTIFDYFYDEKECRFYLVMKYISGGDLAGRLRSSSEGRIDERSVTEWAIQIADVLDYLHNRQPPIVYRDLKPSNIMIDGNNSRVMLIDFGIARWVNKEEKGVTAVGTMGYAPPELFSGNVEPRSDIYSLGSTMFQLLTGADPQSNPLLIFDFQKNPRPRQINPQLTDRMEQILMKAVEYSSEKRFASAAEMREALTEHLLNLRQGKVTFGVAEQPKAGKTASHQPVFCGFCGQKVLPTDAFCPFCGAQQPPASQQRPKDAPPTADFVPPKATARLTIAGTSELGAPMFDLEKEQNLVGRRDPMSNIFPEIDLSKFDPQTKISRRHARIWREKGVFMLEDLGSSNGTVLISQAKQPEKLVKNQPRVLAHGDKIRVGDTTLNFVVE